MMRGCPTLNLCDFGLTSKHCLDPMSFLSCGGLMRLITAILVVALVYALWYYLMADYFKGVWAGGVLSGGFTQEEVWLWIGVILLVSLLLASHQSMGLMHSAVFGLYLGFILWGVAAMTIAALTTVFDVQAFLLLWGIGILATVIAAALFGMLSPPDMMMDSRHRTKSPLHESRRMSRAEAGY